MFYDQDAQLQNWCPCNVAEASGTHKHFCSFFFEAFDDIYSYGKSWSCFWAHGSRRGDYIGEVPRDLPRKHPSSVSAKFVFLIIFFLHHYRLNHSYLLRQYSLPSFFLMCISCNNCYHLFIALFSVCCAYILSF